MCLYEQKLIGNQMRFDQLPLAVSATFEHSNEERLEYVQAIVDEVGVEGAMVFMGHSRGSENALRMGARNADRCAGVLLVNPIGLRPHRGVRQPSVIHTSTVLWNRGWIPQLLLRPFLPWSQFLFVFHINTVTSSNVFENCTWNINWLRFQFIIRC